MSATHPDPARWPLAPGNANEAIEAALQAEADRWPEPSPALRERVAQILRRSTLADTA